jgi:hypothetical protein
LIHEADLVELWANTQNIPLRTIASVTPHQVQAQGGSAFPEKGTVKFWHKVEYVPDEINIDDREADIDVRMYGAPKEIKIEIGKDDE